MEEIDSRDESQTVGVEVQPEQERDPYTPPRNRDQGLALCLSGGGFRAALFHLGGCRRLNELGVLTGLDTVSCVSGGSIFAAFLADRVRSWPQADEGLPDWEEQVAIPFRSLASHNMRTLPLLRRLLPWNWVRESASVEALETRLHTQVTRMQLGDLPQQPQFVFSATDMAYGVNWIFEKGRVGDYQAGYLRPADDYAVSRAVAASSCFPPFFGPLRAGIHPSELRGGAARRNRERDRLVHDLRLTDGGVYDNMGLEPVWKSHRTVLVSDGGAIFDPQLDKGPLLRLSHYATLLGKQSSALRKRWLIAGFRTGALYGTYWGVGSHPSHYQHDAAGYSGNLIGEIISQVRTDLDAFTHAEVAVLENHGYLLADTALHTHVPELVVRSRPLVVPHPEWMDEQAVRSALAESHKVRLLGRWRAPGRLPRRS